MKCKRFFSKIAALNQSASAHVFPHKSGSPLAALAALSAHVKDLECTFLTSTHGMCHESLITLGVTSIYKLLSHLTHNLIRSYISWTELASFPKSQNTFSRENLQKDPITYLEL